MGEMRKKTGCLPVKKKCADNRAESRQPRRMKKGKEGKAAKSGTGTVPGKDVLQNQETASIFLEEPGFFGRVSCSTPLV